MTIDKEKKQNQCPASNAMWSMFTFEENFLLTCIPDISQAFHDCTASIMFLVKSILI